jgi:DNA uptake protein ComE-like DNA-binding protein
MRPRNFAPRALVALLALGLFAGPGAPFAQAARKSAKEKAATAAPAATSGPVDLNTASEKQLEALPGIGASTAKKIIASRPYRTVADLGRAGVSAATQNKIAGMVTTSGYAARTPAPAAPAPARMTTSTRTSTTSRAAAPAASGPVDLNSASEKQLEALPGVGAATAKKIIAGRPYGSTADLSHAGVSAATQKKIAGMVTVNGRAVATPMSAPAATPAVARPAPVRATTASPAVSLPPPSAPARATAPARAVSAPVPGSGMVWVNLPSGIYHHEGDRWYGKTKSGKYMTEQDAIAAGYRAAHNESKTATK